MDGGHLVSPDLSRDVRLRATVMRTACYLSSTGTAYKYQLNHGKLITVVSFCARFCIAIVAAST